MTNFEQTSEKKYQRKVTTSFNKDENDEYVFHYNEAGVMIARYHKATELYEINTNSN